MISKGEGRESTIKVKSCLLRELPFIVSQVSWPTNNDWIWSTGNGTCDKNYFVNRSRVEFRKCRTFSDSIYSSQSLSITKSRKSSNFLNCFKMAIVKDGGSFPQRSLSKFWALGSALFVGIWFWRTSVGRGDISHTFYVTIILLYLLLFFYKMDSLQKNRTFLMYFSQLFCFSC